MQQVAVSPRGGAGFAVVIEVEVVFLRVIEHQFDLTACDVSRSEKLDKQYLAHAHTRTRARAHVHTLGAGTGASAEQQASKQGSKCASTEAMVGS